MCDEWMRYQKLSITFEEFLALPRNNAYKYEYFGGQAHLTPRPKFYHALLDMEAFAAAPQAAADPDVRLRPLETADWVSLAPVFAWAFERQQPFGGLADDQRVEACKGSLERTRSGGDGPVIEAASFVALDGPGGAAVGAILVTLLPDANPSEWGSFHWREPPPPDCVAQRLGRPHLTWIFVHPFCAGRGTGTALLIGAVQSLRALGYREMASTFLPTNESSAMWHWRNGFRLVEYPGSTRRMHRHIRETLATPTPGSGS
jgi:GNAT superfamily N-acetyltransferase